MSELGVISCFVLWPPVSIGCHLYGSTVEQLQIQTHNKIHYIHIVSSSKCGFQPDAQQ